MNQLILLIHDFSVCYLYIKREMFHRAISFDQDIGNWDVSNGTDFVSIPTNVSITLY